MRKLEKLAIALTILLLSAVLVNKFMIEKLNKDLVGDGRYFFKTVFTDTSYFNRYYKATLDEEGVFFEIHYDPVEDATYESYNMIDKHYEANLFWYDALDGSKYIWYFTTLVILASIVAAFPNEVKYRIEQLAFLGLSGALGFSLYQILPALLIGVSLVVTIGLYYLLKGIRERRTA